MATSPVIVSTWSVGRYTITLSVPKLVKGAVQHSAMEWEPGLPTHMTKKMWRQYRAGRDAAFQKLCDATGETALIVEPDSRTHDKFKVIKPRN